MGRTSRQLSSSLKLPLPDVASYLPGTCEGAWLLRLIVPRGMLRPNVLLLRPNVLLRPIVLLRPMT